MLDILDASEGAVLYGDGCFYYKGISSGTHSNFDQLIQTGSLVEFRLIIFRPYIGEAFVGKVQSQSDMGIVGMCSFAEQYSLQTRLIY